MSFDVIITKRSEVNLSDEEIDVLIEDGHACYQKLDGESFVKFFPSFFVVGAELIKREPEKFCLNLWNSLCRDTKDRLDPVSFISAFCSLHRVVKESTDNDIDFCEQVGKLLSGA